MQSPRLPPELEREIFEIAALTRRKDFVSLLCVARRVFEWIEPILYRSITVGHISDLRWLSRALKSKPSAFFAAAVRHIVIYQPDALIEFHALTSICTGTTHLAIAPHPPACPENLPMLVERMPAIQRLAASLRSGFPARKYPTLESFPLQNFTALTHLEIFDEFSDWDTDTQRIVAFVSALPSLTHLALNSDESDLPHSVLASFLERCPNLRVLCWLTSSQEEAPLRAATLLMRLNSSPDVRLVSVTFDEWDEGVSLPGRRTYWDTAEDLIERKRKGEIDVTWPIAQ
ncbi:hypothetical protein C8F01DRAFT_1367550 [Mycena amicta]|nr:hypothetical protein C8F01DRAFT_1367550 [Mycena amicta]